MISVAIDGPSGAGKSTLAKRLAKELGYLYVDTGAMYRSIGLFALRKGVDPKDEAAITALLPQIQIELRYVNGAQRVLLCGEDVSEAIRAEEVGMATSAVSAHPPVRAFLLELQRGMARTHDILMDGRDIGTVILPNASVKIFLTASAEARATRRFRELQEKGVDTDFETVLEDIRRRDYQDSHRATAPLRQAEDAVLVDTSEMDLEESFQALKSLILSRV
ncbi:(d)CMP kinase [Allofournierella massiliensis]|uniref:(d)CMP kinase n=1 Tax=Allofournierella massiliensis TaxID=1650663 RepID=UPI0023F4EACF|nr:(d)CMP kinase [Fournierella massiliensis]